MRVIAKCSKVVWCGMIDMKYFYRRFFKKSEHYDKALGYMYFPNMYF